MQIQLRNGAPVEFKWRKLLRVNEFMAGDSLQESQ